MSLEQKRAQARLIMKRQMARQLMEQNANKMPESDTVNDSMPEWLSGNDRTVVKNLANNPEESLAYLQKQYPDAEFKTDGSGEIIARKRGESAYGRLDPSFSPISNPIGTIKDLWNDTKDIAYDVGEGAAQGVGATAGALAGLGAGSLPAAMAGGAAGSAAASTAKEALRKHFGLTDEMDFGNVATDAAIGGLMPGALKVAGSGAKAVAKKAIPSLYAKATGQTVNKLRLMADRGDEIASMSDDQALRNIESVPEILEGSLNQRKKAAGSAYNAIRESGDSVDMKGFIGKLDQQIAEASERVARNPGTGAFEKELRDLQNFRKEFISENSSPLSMGIDDTLNLDSKLGDMISYGDDVGAGVGQGVDPLKERLAKMLRPEIRGAVNTATGGAKAAADSNYIPLIDEANFTRQYFKNPKKAQASLKNLGTGKDAALDGGFQRLPEDLQRQILTLKDEMDVHNLFSGINKNRILTEEGLSDALVGKTPIEKLLTAFGTGAGYVSGGAVGGVGGAFVGKQVGKAVASPKSILRAAKAGKKAGKGIDALEELLKRRPELQALLSGGAYTATNDIPSR